MCCLVLCVGGGGGAGGEMGWAHTAQPSQYVVAACVMFLFYQILILTTVNTNTAQQTVDKESTPVDNDNRKHSAVCTVQSTSSAVSHRAHVRPEHAVITSIIVLR